MNKQIEQVKEFHKVFEHPIGNTPESLSVKRGLERHDYLKEELQEFKDAVESQDLVEQADACIDIIYFALGTLVELGLTNKYEALFDEVQRSNMSKVCLSMESAIDTAEKYTDVSNIKPIVKYWKVYDAVTNKIVKAVTYSKPNLKEIINS